MDGIKRCLASRRQTEQGETPDQITNCERKSNAKSNKCMKVISGIISKLSHALEFGKLSLAIAASKHLTKGNVSGERS